MRPSLRSRKKGIWGPISVLIGSSARFLLEAPLDPFPSSNPAVSTFLGKKLRNATLSEVS